MWFLGLNIIDSMYTYGKAHETEMIACMMAVRRMRLMTVKGKMTRYGLVEIIERGCGYGIYVNGVLKESSYDLNYILKRFESY